MTKRLLVLLLVVSLFVCPLFADLSSETVTQALNAFLDCVSAEIVCNYSKVPFSMPSSSLSVYPETQLPARISFFLADPAEFVEAIQTKVKGEGSFLSNLWSFLNKSEEDPFVTALYLALSTKEYKDSDYIINGSINFAYPDSTSIATLTSIWVDRVPTDGAIEMDVEISVLGKKLSSPLLVSGNFEIYVNNERKIEVSSVDEYTLNGVTYSGGVFHF